MLTHDISKTVFKGNNITTDFPFAFKVWNENQLTVEVTDLQGSTRVAQDWSVYITENGGTLHYMHEGAPLPTGYSLAILRNMPFSQEVDLVNGTRFDPSIIEDALDKATAERQQLKEAVDRSVKMAATNPDSPEVLGEELFEAKDVALAAASSAEQSAASAQEVKSDVEGFANQAQEAANATITHAQTIQQSVKYLGYIHGGSPNSDAVITLSGGTPSSFI